MMIVTLSMNTTCDLFYLCSFLYCDHDYECSHLLSTFAKFGDKYMLTFFNSVTLVFLMMYFGLCTMFLTVMVKIWLKVKREYTDLYA